MIGYFAPPDLEDALCSELSGITARHGRLILAESSLQTAHFAENIWLNPSVYTFSSVSEAAKQLRALGALWAYYPYASARRGTLIAQQLPYFCPKPIRPFSPLPTAPVGAWTLLDDRTLLASPRTSSPFAHGAIAFLESKIPPSRAYLKLWELFTRIGRHPKAGERCLDLGACPGSWTWVLQSLGAEVAAIDRAPLDPAINALPRVACRQGDAFSQSDISGFDWVFSDVACTPQKLLEWLQRALDRGGSANFVCTLKFQGKENYAIVREFERIAGSRLVHLCHNKHELTWYSIGQAR